jgi:hypothetical protein
MFAEGEELVGAGITEGFTKNRTRVPNKPIAVLSVNPVDVRSRRYQRTGFARVRVRESCSVEDQGSFLFSHVSTAYRATVSTKAGKYQEQCEGK